MSPVLAIFAGTLAVGILDIAYAIGFWRLKGVPATRILQSVAAGLLGREASIGGGMKTAMLGLGLHFCIAFGVMLVYWLASARLPILVRRWLLCGMAYGIGVYLVMQYVVLPLSATPGGGTFNLVWVVCSVLAHLFFVGVPASWFTRMGRGRRD